MSAARWYFKSGDGERGPFSAQQLQRMAAIGDLHPETLVRKGNREGARPASRSFGWEQAGRVAFLAEFFDGGASDATERRDGDAALSEFIPNFDPGEYDKDSQEVFRRIVMGINRLRGVSASGRAEESRPFTLNLKQCGWDGDTILVLSQIEHAIEQLRAAMEHGALLPSVDYVFQFEALGWHDEMVEFMRRVQAALNDLRKRLQSPRARNSQRTLFGPPQAQGERHKESVALPKPAPEAPQKDESYWRNLVATARDSGQHEQAIDLAKQGIRQHPRSDWLWRELGNGLVKTGKLDEAEKILNEAHRLNPAADWLWRYRAGLHRKRKNIEREIEALEHLYSLGEANSTDLNQLGIAYHNHRNLKKAEEYYRQSADSKPDAATWFNLGLVFNDPEVSQDADAADAYRRALALDPNYDRARERLETTKQKLLPLAERALIAAAGLVESKDSFAFYLSPFEALQLEKVAAIEQPDVKEIQRAKKILLSEIDLNDGKVPWLDDYSLDKSRAIAIVDELDDEAKRRYHWAIFQNKRLLRFLTRGDIEHFLYSDDYSPQATLNLLDTEPEFRTFLSKPFAQQYNAVLTRAIKERLLPVVEVLFDGRRWVTPEDDDICFEGAFKLIGELVEKMRTKVKDGCSHKISLHEMDDFLRQHSFPELFNLLPTHFAGYQGAVGAEIRSLAVSCYNEHDDSDLSKGVLSLCKQFTSRNEALTKSLAADFTKIEEIISKERKHSFSGQVRPGKILHVTRAGITFGGDTISANEVETIRWGIFIRTVNGSEDEHSFSLVVGSARNTLRVRWDRRGVLGEIRSLFRKSDQVVPIAQLPTEAQELNFQWMIDAAWHYLVPPLLEKLVKRLQVGQTVVIGPCTLSSAGVAFRTGFIFRKDHLLAWNDADTETGSGQISVFSRTNPNVRASMVAKDTDNAVVLPILFDAMCERTGSERKRSPRVATEHPGNREFPDECSVAQAAALIVSRASDR